MSLNLYDVYQTNLINKKLGISKVYLE